jgi:hypothetical protein
LAGKPPFLLWSSRLGQSVLTDSSIALILTALTLAVLSAAQEA